MPGSSLPPEFEILSRIADAEEANVRELFQYALTMELIDSGKAKLVEKREVGMRQQLTLRTSAGDTFVVLKPDIRDELLAQMREMVREALEEDRDSAK